MAEGYSCIGLDIERHDYGTGGYPGQLVLQDVLTLHGSQFKNATCIVASPPCQEYSYMAMPWTRAKKIAEEYRTGVRDVKKLTELFDACFRIQREAISATVKNCRNCDATGITRGCCRCEVCDGRGVTKRYIPMVVENVRGARPWVGRSAWNFGSFHLWGDVPALMPLSYGTKLPKAINESIRQGRSPARWTNPAEHYFGKKQGGNWGHDPDSLTRRFYSSDPSRKAASAQIAKIPFPLSHHIARCFKEDAWNPDAQCASGCS